MNTAVAAPPLILERRNGPRSMLLGTKRGGANVAFGTTNLRFTFPTGLLSAYLPTPRCSQATSSPWAPSARAYLDGWVAAPVPEVAGGSPSPGTRVTFSRGAIFRSGCRQLQPPWRRDNHTTLSYVHMLQCGHGAENMTADGMSRHYPPEQQQRWMLPYLPFVRLYAILSRQNWYSSLFHRRAVLSDASRGAPSEPRLVDTRWW